MTTLKTNSTTDTKTNKHLLFLSGSTRKGSLNSLLAKAACDFATTQGVTAEYIDLADYEMPLFNQDDESVNGIPENVIRLKQKFIEADGFFIATPEYNGSFTPVLKNALDWISRLHQENEAPMAAYANKAAAIGGASPGGFGAMRALVPLRLLLANVGVNTVGNQIAVGTAHEAFNEDGKLVSERYQGMLENIISTLIRIS